VPSQSDISSQIVATLGISEPDLDTSVGSVTRTIIDAVASAISDASLDTQLLTYQYNIYAMTGSDLDTFVQLFGMSRYPAVRSSGTVTFTRTTATDVVSVPINTQVSTTDFTVVVQTLAAGILGVGALSVTVPAQATVAGPQGNVAANTLTVLNTAVSEITAVTNLGAFTGGQNQETDTQLQARWVATVFKSMAGTSQMFLGIALNNPFCTAANVVGPETRRTEQLQIQGGSATSTVNDAQYIYPSGEIAGIDIDNGNIASPGVQYTWNYNQNPPSITAIDQSYFASGTVFQLSYIYLDEASRNAPASGIFNRVDVYCAGQDPVSASQTLHFSPAITWSSSSGNTFWTGAFVHPDGTSPSAGNIFIPLAFGPIITVPGTITVGSVTYGLASAAHPLGSTSGGIVYAYQIVHQTGAFGYSPYSYFGIDWVASQAPATGSVLVISEDYTYNGVPSAIQQDLTNWSLAGTDVLAHQANILELQFSLAIVYAPSSTVSTTQNAIQSALQTYLSQLAFNAFIYPSSVISIVEAVPGVTACRFLEGADYVSWNPATPNNFSVGIQQLVNGVVTNSFVNSLGAPLTVQTDDATVPAFGNVVLVTKALNTLGAFG
jgi:uncharacterized phage protein gp47/JayE